MGDVHQDAQPVHLGDHFLAELADPAVLRFGVAEILPRVAGIGDVVMPVVGEGDVAGAQLVVLLEQGKVLADHVAVLDPDHGHQFPLGVDALRVVRGVGEFDDVRMHRGGAVDGVELRDRPLLGGFVVLGRPLGLSEVDDEEPDVEAAFLHPGIVHLEILVEVSGIDFLGRVVEGDVDMGVEGHHRIVDALGLGEDRFLLGHRGGFFLTAAATGQESGHQDDQRPAAKQKGAMFQGHGTSSFPVPK